MKSKIARIIIYMTVPVFIFSCDKMKYNQIEMTPFSHSIEGELGRYFDIVDDVYTFKEFGKFGNRKQNHEKYGHSAKIKIKRNNIKFEFNVDSINHKEPRPTLLYIKLLDSKGQEIKKMEWYTSTTQDFKKLLNAKQDSTVLVEFTWMFADKKEHLPKLPEGILKFKTYSTKIRLIEK